MSTHSIAKAKNQLSELIDRALKGEGVVITRHGHPVVELKGTSNNDDFVVGSTVAVARW
jgi:prevent-host-death family protein